jgi:translation initiation factor IF-2
MATAVGTVIETHMEKGKGNVITVLIQFGTLKQGDHLILDTDTSNVRVMYDDQNKEIKEAHTSMPVKITGFPVAPDLGSKFIAVHDVKEAKKIAKQRQDNKKSDRFRSKVSMKMENFLKPKDGSENMKVLSVIIIGDSKGSVEAIVAQANNQSNEKVQVQVIRSDMGQISKADILLSAANDAPIYTFNVKVNQTTRSLIEKQKVKVFNYNVIYNLLDDMNKHMLGIQDTEYKEVPVGKARVKQIFTFSKVGTIAGSSLTEGKATNKAKARITRGEEVVFDGDLSSLRIEKEVVREVIGVGKEFAFTTKDFDDIKEKDIVEFYELEEIVYE